MTASAPFHLLAKPAGPLCNLDCQYCFYLKKAALFPRARFHMPDTVLDAFVRGYIETQPGSEVTFAWQGGEPTILGVDFYKRALALQRQYANGKRIYNALQTNGTLLDDEWGRFFRENEFLVGLSVDGPRELHDHHRLDKGGRPTFDRVMRGLEVLRKHQVEYNLLTVVSAHNAREPRAVYRFLKGLGTPYLQFIPLVERAFTGDEETVAQLEPASSVTTESVTPQAFGAFLCTVFDEWVRRDIGRVFVQAFDNALGQWMGMGSSLCVHAETCGQALAVEHNGDVFACDHYVYDEFRRGNLVETPLATLVDAPAQKQFGIEKFTTLPAQCRACDVRFACNGGCPKHRIANTAAGEPGLNWLCAGYRQFYHHIAPAMRGMSTLIRTGRSPAEYMATFRQNGAADRNAACPCGSGKKFKRCCGA